MAMSGSSAMEQQMMVATKVIEQSIDAEIERLDNLDGDELENIRKQRMEAMRKRALKKNEWTANGHGEYTELYDEKEFFEASKKSDNFVCHFYRDSFVRCAILDKHLGILARKHIETKFCKINAEKAPFLTERLKIRVLPTMTLIQNGKTRDFVVGFTDMGNTDEFTTEMLEWRIAKSDVIEYAGDLLTPPTAANDYGRQKVTVTNKKTIRGRDNKIDDDDSDSDY